MVLYRNDNNNNNNNNSIRDIPSSNIPTQTGMFSLPTRMKKIKKRVQQGFKRQTQTAIHYRPANQNETITRRPGHRKITKQPPGREPSNVWSQTGHVLVLVNDPEKQSDGVFIFDPRYQNNFLSSRFVTKSFGLALQETEGVPVFETPDGFKVRQSISCSWWTYGLTHLDYATFHVIESDTFEVIIGRRTIETLGLSKPRSKIIASFLRSRLRMDAISNGPEALKQAIKRQEQEDEEYEERRREKEQKHKVGSLAEAAVAIRSKSLEQRQQQETSYTTQEHASQNLTLRHRSGTALASSERHILPKDDLVSREMPLTSTKPPTMALEESQPENSDTSKSFVRPKQISFAPCDLPSGVPASAYPRTESPASNTCSIDSDSTSPIHDSDSEDLDSSSDGTHANRTRLGDNDVDCSLQHREALETPTGSIRVAHWLNTRSIDGANSRGNGRTESHSNSSLPQFNQSGSSSTSNPKEYGRGGKKKERPDDKEDGRTAPKRRRREDLANREVASRLLACPFAKYDPMNFPNCWDKAASSSSHWKQHLRKEHYDPVHCPICGIVFTQPDRNQRRDEHLQQQSCQKEDLTGRWCGISEDQQKWLGVRRNENNDMKKYWIEFYAMRFGDPLPHNPYMEDFMALTIRKIQEAVTNSVMSRVAEEVALGSPSNGMERGNNELETQAAIYLAVAFEDVMARLRTNTQPRGQPASLYLASEHQHLHALASDSGFASATSLETSRSSSAHASTQALPELAIQALTQHAGDDQTPGEIHNMHEDLALSGSLDFTFDGNCQCQFCLGSFGSLDTFLYQQANGNFDGAYQPDPSSPPNASTFGIFERNKVATEDSSPVPDHEPGQLPGVISFSEGQR